MNSECTFSLDTLLMNASSEKRRDTEKTAKKINKKMIKEKSVNNHRRSDTPPENFKFII